MKQKLHNVPFYIICDLHGCYKTLMKLVEFLPYKEKSHLVFVGDLVDRGKYSAEVVKFMKEGSYDCVIGNHEELMLDAFEAPSNGEGCRVVIL